MDTVAWIHDIDIVSWIHDKDISWIHDILHDHHHIYHLSRLSSCHISYCLTWAYYSPIRVYWAYIQGLDSTYWAWAYILGLHTEPMYWVYILGHHTGTTYWAYILGLQTGSRLSILGLGLQ